MTTTTSSSAAPVATRPPPDGWPRISSSPTYDDAAKAIAWLQRAFGFEAKLVIEAGGGKIAHSELVLGGGLIMIGDAKADARPWRQSPAALGGANTQTLCVFVDDADAHCERARAAGATIAMEPTTTDHGAAYWTDRSYEAIDLEGHHWWFIQRIR
ncbi:MAG: VOC family protein [Acidobacteriota bacterium]